MLSCDVIIWDDNTPLFIFPENFTHSENGLFITSDEYGDSNGSGQKQQGQNPAQDFLPSSAAPLCLRHVQLFAPGTLQNLSAHYSSLKHFLGQCVPLVFVEYTVTSRPCRSKPCSDSQFCLRQKVVCSLMIWLRPSPAG